MKIPAYMNVEADLHERLTMRGILLHGLGEAISSINVIASALLIKFVNDDTGWKHRIDPIARQHDFLTVVYEFFTVLSFSRPRSEGWPHHGRTFSIYLCPL